MLFRNCFVIFISFCSFAALAVGPNPSSPSDKESSPLKASASSSSPRYQPYPPNPSSRAVQDSRMQPRSQGTSSSQGQSSKFSIHALLSDVGGTSGQGAPVALRPLAPQLSLSPFPVFAPIGALLGTGIVRREGEEPEQVTPAPHTVSNPVVFDFSDPKLDGQTVISRSQELRAALENPQGRSVILRLHQWHLFSVYNAVKQFQCSYYSPANITLEIHKFILLGCRDNMNEFINFLEIISYTVEKISFIDSSISADSLTSLRKKINEGKLRNIVEIKFIKTKMSSGTFTDFLPSIAHLTKLKHITFNIINTNKEKARGEATINGLHKALTPFLINNKQIEILTLAGDLFDEQMMGCFIDALIKSDLKLMRWQQLNILETSISQEKCIHFLEELGKISSQTLEVLAIPNVHSDRYDELVLELINDDSSALHTLTRPADVNKD